MLFGILLAMAGTPVARAQCPDLQLPPLSQQATNPIRFIATDGAPASYYRTTLTNVPAGSSLFNGSYLSWCIDYSVPLRPDSWLNGTFYNSALDSLPPHVQSTNWDRVNYILNHKLGSAIDVQASIWHFIGGPVPLSDPVFYPPSAAARSMISNALARGDGYLPSGPGAVVAVIIDAGPDIQTIIIEVAAPLRRAPVALPDALTTDRNQQLSFPASLLLANDYDPDGDAIFFAGVSSNTTQGGAVIGSGTNLLYTPPAGFVGNDTFTYTITDNLCGLSTGTVNISVRAPTNQPPVVVNDTVQTLRDQPVIIPVIVVLTNDFDPDGGVLVVIGVSTNSANGGMVRFDGTNIVYIPPPGFVGPDTFTYTVSDGQGGTATGTVTVNVIRPNSPPVVVNDTVQTLRDQPVIIPVIVVLTNDFDPDGGVLVVIGVSTNSANGGMVRFDGTNIVYIPPPGFVGPDTFTYTVSDGQGGTTTGTVTVNVMRPNTPPVAVNDALATDANTPLSILGLSLLANDTDADRDPLTIQTVVTNSVRGGVVRFDGTNVVYTPPAGFVGTDGFSYTISDGHGGTATATVVVTVRPPNRPPMTGNLTATTPMNTVLTIPLTNLLALASDPDGDAIQFDHVMAATTAGGSAIVVFTNILYFPPVDFVGQDSFRYVINDGKGHSATGVVMITVIAAALPIFEEAAVFNPQTGLFEQRVTVANESSNTIAAFQLCISNLRSNIQCRSAFAKTNGTNFVQVNRAINPNTSVVVRVEYYVPDRRPFTPVIALKTVMPTSQPATNGVGVAIDRCFLDTRIANEPRYVIEFTSTPAKAYTIIYSDDMRSWKAATPTVTATASRTQWYDDGPPKTDSKPAVKGVRFYKVIQAP